MFKGSFENAIGRYEGTGSRLEDEFVGTVNGRKYKELAYAFLHKDNKANSGALTDDMRFEEILKMRELAAHEFENTLDFKEKYIKRSDSMRLVEKCQVGDPEHPSRFFAKKLYDAVRERFNKDDFTLKFFTATGGTHLDVAHKIDCYFKLYLKDTGQEIACATMDLTQNSNKSTAEANILVSISPEEQEKCDSSQGNKKYDPKFLAETITRISGEVVDALMNDYRNRQEKN